LVYLEGHKILYNFLGGCSAGLYQVYIDISGNIRPCPFLDKNIGNAATQDIVLDKNSPF
jgi:MoaA/NifB/PqqE/SkfB family radical SAM enzyme